MKGKIPVLEVPIMFGMMPPHFSPVASVLGDASARGVGMVKTHSPARLCQLCGD